jgi:hypothetical protein
MNCSKRTRVKIFGYSVIFKKLGILSEKEYKHITGTYH